MNINQIITQIHIETRKLIDERQRSDYIPAGLFDRIFVVSHFGRTGLPAGCLRKGGRYRCVGGGNCRIDGTGNKKTSSENTWMDNPGAS